MKKGFISYRFTGETPASINALVTPVQQTLQDMGHQAYVNFHDADLQPGTDNHNTFGPQDYIFHAFQKINQVDFAVALVTTDEKSEGMALEIGYAAAQNKPTIIAVKDGVTKTYLPTIGTVSFTWRDYDDLQQQLRAIDVDALQAQTFE